MCRLNFLETYRIAYICSPDYSYFEKVKIVKSMHGIREVGVRDNAGACVQQVVG
jgi:hypothetical protein